MKFNWGTGIAIFIGLFITFILSFVIRASMVETDLYAEDYYEQEIGYQQTIDAKSNALPYQNNITVLVGEKLIEIKFPEALNNVDAGSVQFYKPNDASQDKNLSLSILDGSMLFDKATFQSGDYEVIIKWKMDQKDFLVKKNIEVK